VPLGKVNVASPSKRRGEQGKRAHRSVVNRYNDCSLKREEERSHGTKKKKSYDKFRITRSRQVHYKRGRRDGSSGPKEVTELPAGPATRRENRRDVRRRGEGNWKTPTQRGRQGTKKISVLAGQKKRANRCGDAYRNRNVLGQTGTNFRQRRGGT